MLRKSLAIRHTAIVQQNSIEALHLSAENRRQHALIGVHAREEESADLFTCKVVSAFRHGLTHAGVSVLVEQHV